jgi:hypothetical protein
MRCRPPPAQLALVPPDSGQMAACDGPPVTAFREREPDPAWSNVVSSNLSIGPAEACAASVRRHQPSATSKHYRCTRASATGPEKPALSTS